MRNKVVAGIFALIFGSWGLHRFYLGQRRRGIFYFVATVFLFIASVANNAPLVLIMGAIGLLDAMILFSMPGEEFDEKYNTRKHQEDSRAERRYQRYQRRHERRVATLPAAGSASKSNGIKKFKEYDYEGAIEDFKKALKQKFDDPATHFNLACCYSLLERPDPAFFHLTKAVHFGFVDFDKIEKHDGLAYLRTLPEFEEFVKNGYQRFATPAEELPIELPSREEKEETLLDQIKRIEALRNKGILTEEEFVVQTKRVLGN